MRLVSFGAAGPERLGALGDNGRRSVDLNDADAAIPPGMLQFLQGDFWSKARRVLADIPLGLSSRCQRCGDS